MEAISRKWKRKLKLQLPTVEKMLEDRRKFEEYKQDVEINAKLTEFELPKWKAPLFTDECKYTEDKDCKHLSKLDMEVHFEKNLQFLGDIFHGRTFSQRHETYNNGKRHLLKYNTSFINFTSDQVNYLDTLLKKHFAAGNCLEHLSLMQYHFMVLLPELCQKIFMDVHDMDLQECTDYLENRPLEDVV